MNNKRLISLLLAFVLIFTLVTPCMAKTIEYTGGTMEIYDGDVVQDEFTANRTVANYKITATDNMYYSFSIENQSVEARTGIAIADKFLNLFLGKISIQITDQYEKILSDFTVKCGYRGGVTLKFEKNATYYIKVNSNLDGFYRLKVKAYEDIGGDTWQTATESLTIGRFISSIDANGDEDWYYFETDDTDSFYDFNLENISGSSNMYMYVYEYVEGAGQTPLRDTFYIYASHSNTSNKQLKLKPNAKYYVCVYLSSGIGGYQLDIAQTLDAVGDTQETAYEVEPDTKVTTALDGKGDIDYFKFTTKDYDAYYYFDIENLSIDTQYYIYLYDAQGNQLDYNYTSSSYDLSLNYKLSPSTEYYFTVKANLSGLGNYNFKITDVRDNFDNVQENAGQIQLNTEITESISGDKDIDYYKFTTEDFDAYYYFNIENLSIDTQYYIYLYDAQKNQLDYNYTSSSYNLSLNYKLNSNTEYYFAVKANSTGKGNYKVKVTSLNDYYPNTFEQAKKISLNDEISASISGYGDVDFFKFTTEDFDAYYYFDIKNLSIDKQYYIYLYDAQGNQLDYDYTSSSYDLSFSYKLEPNTENYFCIKANSSGTGNYKVVVSYESDAEGDTKEKAASISLNESLTRELSSDDDIDWFKFTLDYDCNVRFVAINESGETKRIAVYSAINREIVSSGFYSEINETVILDAGEYFIKVYNNDGYYTLAVGDCGSAHIEKTRYVKATDKADGIKTTYCTSCGTVIKKEVVPRIDKVTLSFAKSTYNGSVKKPAVTVYDVKGNKIPSSQYSVKYPAGRVDVGTYIIKIEFKSGYTGTKNASFKIVAQSSSKLTAKLSASNYHYNGKTKKPSVTVKNFSGKTVSPAYYTVQYLANSKNVGKYKVKIVFKGNYSGTKYLYFNVNPAKTSVAKLTAGGKKLTVKLTKASSAAGYQIQYSTSKSFKSAKTKTVTSNKTTTVTLNGLYAKKTYYVRVRSYKKVSGKTFYSSWSSYKANKTK